MTNLTTVTKRLLLFGAKYTGLFRSAERYTRRSLRILCDPGLLTDLEAFEGRLQRLARARYPVLSLDEAAGCLARQDLPDHATVIVMHGGTENPSQGAVSILHHYHFPADFLAAPEAIFPEAIERALMESGGKKHSAANPGFNSGPTSCYKFIWLLGGDAMHAIEFEAELSGFLAMWRNFGQKAFPRDRGRGSRGGGGTDVRS